jgi:hypothetical protein
MARFVAFVLLLPSSVFAADLTGSWEIQSLGGDRAVVVQQRGSKLLLHRVMWPTFEGHKYKLEHLYRGDISGSTVAGDLLVKEEGLADYEILRRFDGSIGNANRMTIDGLPMNRIGGTPASGSSEPPASGTAEPPPPPSGSVSAPGAGLFDRIVSSPGMESLFDEALKVAIPAEVAALTAHGDDLYAGHSFRAALVKYEEASNAGGGADPQLLHRRGRCLLALERWADAKRMLRSALKLDPGNQVIARDYERAKRRARRTR